MAIKSFYNSFSQGTSTISYLIGKKAEGLEKSEDNKGPYKEKGPHYSTSCKAEWEGLQQCNLYSISNMDTQPPSFKGTKGAEPKGKKNIE